MDNNPIRWDWLGFAVNYFQGRGFTYVEAPWFVHRDFTKVTAPSGCDNFRLSHDNIFAHTYNRLVASGEQSLLSMTDLVPGKYICCTPCFRLEDPDPTGLHQQSFMKVELFTIGSSESYTQLMAVAMDLFNILVEDEKFHIEETAIGHDITCRGIEVGSYGKRTASVRGKETTWNYGTGLALPRFTMASGKQI